MVKEKYGTESRKIATILWYNDDMASLKQIRISEEAYEVLREMSKQPEYKGRRAVGVLDKLILGRFSTNGSGRVCRDKSDNDKKQKC